MVQVHIDKPIIIPRLPVVTNDKQRVKLIKTIESYCRSAMEYTDVITYLRKYVNMDQCTFLENFKAGSKRGMIEIHHAPYTLFSIVDIVMRKQDEQLGYIDDFTLDCLERRFKSYKQEGGNTYVDSMMEELRRLPRQNRLNR